MRNRTVGVVAAGVAAAALVAGAPAASGACTINCRNDVAQASAQRIGADGRPDVVVVGSTTQGTDPATSNTAVAVFNEDGTPDTSFGGGDGAVVIPVSPGNDEAHDVHVLPGGGIVLAGRADGDAYMARLTSTGALDPACGGSDADTGIERFASPAGEVAGVAFDRTPGFIWSQYYFPDLGFPAQAFKTTDDCELDTDFGIVDLVFGADSLREVRDVEVLANGRFRFAGQSADGAGGVAGLDADGTPDTGVGGTGYLTVDLTRFVVDLLERPAGGLFASGESQPLGPGAGVDWVTTIVDAGPQPSVINDFFGNDRAGRLAPAAGGDVLAVGTTGLGDAAAALLDGTTLLPEISFGPAFGRAEYPTPDGQDGTFVGVQTLLDGHVIVGSARTLATGSIDFMNHSITGNGDRTGTDTIDFSEEEPATVEPPPTGGPSTPPLATEPPASEQPEPCSANAALPKPCADLEVSVDAGGVFEDDDRRHVHADRPLKTSIEVRNYGPNVAAGTVLTAQVGYRARVESVERVTTALLQNQPPLPLPGETPREPTSDVRTDTVDVGRQVCSSEPAAAGPERSLRCELGDIPASDRGGGFGTRFVVTLAGPTLAGQRLAVAAQASSRSAEVNPPDNADQLTVTAWAPDTDIVGVAEQLRAQRRGTVRGTVSRSAGARGATARIAQAGRRLGRIAKVEVALVRRGGGARVAQRRRVSCQWLRNPRARLVRRKPDGRVCDEPVWLRAKLKGDRWSYTIRRRLPCGRYTLLARATNRVGVTETRFSRRDGNRIDLRLC